MSYAIWLQHRPHIMSTFGTAFGLGSFVVLHRFRFSRHDGLVNDFAQELGVAVVGNHGLDFMGDVGTGREKSLSLLFHLDRQCPSAPPKLKAYETKKSDSITLSHQTHPAIW